MDFLPPVGARVYIRRGKIEAAATVVGYTRARHAVRAVFDDRSPKTTEAYHLSKVRLISRSTPSDDLIPTGGE